jgi:hypothetical protein
MRHFPTTVVAFSYAHSSAFPIASQERLWPNGPILIGIASMAEKLLDRMRRIIRLKHYSVRTDQT